MSSQRTLSVSFRDFSPSDYERYLEIYNANYPDYPISVAEQRARDESIDRSKYLLKLITCIDTGTGMIVGIGRIVQPLDMYHPQKFMINIYVDPVQQFKGVGDAIYDRLSRELEDLNASVVWAMNREDLTRQREFFQKRGFVERRRDWESRLDLNTFDLSKFQNYSRTMAREGITFTTLPEVRQQGETALRQLHELVQHISEDMPRQAEFTPLPYEQWQKTSMENPRVIPEAYFVACDGPRYVGLSDLFRNEKEPLILSQDDTGVRREYRGRGIATALKVKVIEWAKQHGYVAIETWNDASNAPMLAVNTKLGFKRRHSWILLEKIVS